VSVDPRADGWAPAAGPEPTAPSEPAPSEPAPEATVVDEAPDAAAAPPADVEALAAERDQYLDALRRMKAEFDNFRKRTDRERQSSSALAARDLVTELLPVMDSLERAVASVEGQPEGVTAGVGMVRQQLESVLRGRGVATIDAMGEPFDPNVHEAILSMPSADHQEGTVIEVVQRGYRLDDAVLRPARVVVAASPSA
jgi:molecular chaperone GrpE